MALSSLTDLMAALRACEILSSEQMKEAVRLESQFSEPRSMARHLMERGWLTPYQVNQLLQGQGKALKLGSYLLQQRLGEGGAGQVYKANHCIMNRSVALKILRPELLKDKEIVGRFYREIQGMSQVSHPNIIQAYDAGQFGATHVLAMEYVEGDDLSQMVQKAGPLPAMQAADYIRQAALGLQHIHERGLVHRDIKPSNLLVSRSPQLNSDQGHSLTPVPQYPFGLLKILDLGLARLRSKDGKTRSLTAKDGSTMGTVDYMAPEQAIDFHEVDIRADIYGLGCTFYFLLTGRPPFPEGTVAQILMHHQQDEPPAIAGLRSDVPASVIAIVQKMIAKQRESRYQTPGEVAGALAAWLVKRPVTERLHMPTWLKPRMPTNVGRWLPSIDWNWAGFRYYSDLRTRWGRWWLLAQLAGLGLGVLVLLSCCMWSGWIGG